MSTPRGLAATLLLNPFSTMCRKRHLALCSLLILLSVIRPEAARSQAFAGETPMADLIQSPGDSVAADTLPAAPKPHLLPANMSWAERALWDEHGLFRSTGLASPLTTESRKSELALRRTMLTIHQVGGFVTLGCMATAAWYGQHALDHPAVRTYRGMHQTFVALTIPTYSATALLAALSPPPLIRRDEVSTTTIHKTLAWVHFAGMIVTPILGAFLHRNHRLSYDQLVRYHQVSAYVTTAAMAGSMLVITF